MPDSFSDIRTEPKQVLDLFCGAGGMTLGCEQADYDVIAGVDNDETAMKTYRENFDHRGIVCDLSSLDPEEFEIEFGITPSDVDIIVGGPPCQAFSIAGKRDEDDPRANLVFRFAEYVDYYQPNSFVMENVTGIESFNDGKTLDLLYDDFDASGYEIQHQTLNAAEYGVPQKRQRVFVVGVHNEYDGSYSFPDPTHGPTTDVEQSSQQTVVADD